MSYYLIRFYAVDPVSKLQKAYEYVYKANSHETALARHAQQLSYYTLLDNYKLDMSIKIA